VKLVVSREAAADLERLHVFLLDKTGTPPCAQSFSLV